MKIFKRVLALIITAVMVCAASGVSAEPLFNASLSLSSDIKNSDVTYLSYNEPFDVKLSLKTGKNYYAGPFSAQVFYTNSVLKNTSAEFNKSGKLYSCAKTYSSVLDSNKMTSAAVTKYYPHDWGTEQRKKYDFCNIIMIPNTQDCQNSVDSLDESLVTLHLSSGANTGSGTVFVSVGSIKTVSNIYGETYLSCLTNNGKIVAERYDYGVDAALDLANATLTFTVTDAGDVDGNKKLNSSDALLILQHITDINTQKGDAAKRCDLDGSGTVGSVDALGVLQISIGLLRINDIIKK